MWEMTSGVSAFHNIPHDLNLSLNICRGIRPEIIEGTMPKYVELMKRCWNNDPEKRPTANELSKIFNEWKIDIQRKKMKKREFLFLVIMVLFFIKKLYFFIFTILLINFIENEPEVVYHPKSCYTSRKIDYSAKLNEILSQDELSSKIIIMDDNDKNYTMTSVNLGMYQFIFKKT